MYKHISVIFYSLHSHYQTNAKTELVNCVAENRYDANMRNFSAISALQQLAALA